jgi:hypothetical protein
MVHVHVLFVENHPKKYEVSFSLFIVEKEEKKVFFTKAEKKN